MPQNISLLSLSVIAAVALDAGRFVGLDGNYANNTAPAFGVTRTAAAQGDRVSCDVLGTAIVMVADVVSKGDYLEVTEEGMAVPQDTGIAVCQALEDGAGEGSMIEVLLLPSGPAPA